MKLAILLSVLLIVIAMFYSGMPWDTNRYVRRTTAGSKKWESGRHNAGCVFHAPEGVCICDQVRREYVKKYGEIKRQT